MKKTIALLLAAAGATLATEPLQLKWENNTASLTTDINGNVIDYNGLINYNYSNTLAVAISLNWQAIVQAVGTGSYNLFQIADSNENKNHGLCLYFSQTGKNYVDAWTNSQDDVYNEFFVELQDSWTTATKAAIVYNSYISGKSISPSFDAYLYIWDENGNQKTVHASYANAHATSLESLNAISYDDTYINNINVYNDLFGGNDAAKLAERVVASIPEPTTATLSLLALAGLAARRRRR